MRFATLRTEDREQAAIGVDDRWVLLDRLDPTLGGDLLVLIMREWDRERLTALEQRAASMGSSASTSRMAAVYAPPYRHPRLIWGIGLNYADHASDLSETAPEDPASFIKGDHTVIGHRDTIALPRQSTRVTAEAEVALIVGKVTTGPSSLAALFGVTTVLDQTAEDILQQNPRFLTRSKNFATFFAFGPEVVTLDSLDGDLGELHVRTVVNGDIVRSNTVDNMMHPPGELLEFHTSMMPMFPGDIISTGTPGAGVINRGDVAEARVDGFLPLVVDVDGDRT